MQCVLGVLTSQVHVQSTEYGYQPTGIKSFMIRTFRSLPGWFEFTAFMRDLILIIPHSDLFYYVHKEGF